MLDVKHNEAEIMVREEEARKFELEDDYKELHSKKLNLQSSIEKAVQRLNHIDESEKDHSGFQMKMVSSLKGAEMIEAQRDSRRQRHIACLKECEKFVE